jgi:MFS family permease
VTLTARDGAASTVFLAICATVASSVPVFLISALFVLISAELAVPAWALGLIVASFWVAAAFTSGPAGTLTTHIGSRRVIILTCVVAAASLAGAAVLTQDWPWFILWAVVGGISTGLCHPSTNHLIGLRVSLERRALAFGLKQSAVPLAALAAGLAIPLISEQLGWRAVYLFGVGGALAVLVLFLTFGPRRPPRGTVRKRTSTPLDRDQRKFFRLLACSTMLGAGAAACVSTWAVVAAVDRGLDPAPAGVLFGTASLLGGIMRVVVGATDTGKGTTLRTIGVMQLAGGAGAVLLLVPGVAPFAVGVALALGIGWGWTGLGHFVVSLRAGTATPAATGLVQTGSYVGCAAGPLLTGVLYTQWGSDPIWVLCILAFGIAGVIALALQHRISKGRQS